MFVLTLLVWLSAHAMFWDCVGSIPVVSFFKDFYMLKPFLAVLALLMVLVLCAVVVPSVVQPVMVISFCFSLLKALTVIAVARFALAYLDARLGVDVNCWLKSRASDDNKAVYFSVRFAAVFVVFGFVMA